MGVGIIESHKKSGNLLLKYRILGDHQILLDSLNGTLGSSTGESNRGKGLPQLKEMIEKEYISNLVIITNTITLQYKNGNFNYSKNPNFVGTYFSWTINKENFQNGKI